MRSKLALRDLCPPRSLAPSHLCPFQCVRAVGSKPVASADIRQCLRPNRSAGETGHLVDEQLERGETHRADIHRDAWLAEFLAIGHRRRGGWECAAPSSISALRQLWTYQPGEYRNKLRGKHSLDHNSGRGAPFPAFCCQCKWIFEELTRMLADCRAQRLL